MKIIFCTWGSLCEPGMKKAIEESGHELVLFNKTYTDSNYDKEYLLSLADKIKNTPDAGCVLSINYTPIIARACKPFKIPYISYTADCPCSNLFSKTIEYDTNRIFLFDKIQTEKFLPHNPDNIHHLPLATDTSHWDNISVNQDDITKYSCDISFVGSLYSEMCPYNKIEHRLSHMTRGYVDGLIAAQQNVYGYYFVEDAITEDWAKQFQQEAQLSDMAEDYFNDIRAVIADNYIGYKCTEQDRINTIKAISQQFKLDLWTLSDTTPVPMVNHRGPADSGIDMPKIFKCSKINLNMTNKAMRSGIPLRIFDIMGCGGFLISNYQPEILDYFVPGEDIVLYDSIPDLLEKIGYYLEHDEERDIIARNGYEKVKTFHNYNQRLSIILENSNL